MALPWFCSACLACWWLGVCFGDGCLAFGVSFWSGSFLLLLLVVVVVLGFGVSLGLGLLVWLACLRFSLSLLLFWG